mmetsp:Transcript_25769/g.21206  ORF Transcript_25769/g.21206 Transcript_25769/m.21206 type:complete len:130 (-) Transcript_25769:139-528(-)
MSLRLMVTYEKSPLKEMITNINKRYHFSAPPPREGPQTQRDEFNQLFFAHIQGREDTIKHLNQERHPLYMLQRRRRGTTALPLTTRSMDPLEVWGVQDLGLLGGTSDTLTIPSLHSDTPGPMNSPGNLY